LGHEACAAGGRAGASSGECLGRSSYDRLASRSLWKSFPILGDSGLGFRRCIGVLLTQFQNSSQLPFPLTLAGIPNAWYGHSSRSESKVSPKLVPKDGEVALNQQVKDLIQKLGEAIHESVSESDQISGVVREIRAQGFDVLLMLEATIGLNEVDDDVEEADAEEGNEATDGPFTRHDLTFLKSLRITTEETGPADGSILPDA
jgi:uncharacterized protein (UPF0335 family)